MERKRETGNKEKGKKGKGQPLGSSPTKPDSAVDKETCGKRAKRKRRKRAGDHRGIMRYPQVTATATSYAPLFISF